MGERPPPGRRRAGVYLAVAFLLLASLLFTPAPAGASGVPALPSTEYTRFLGNLSVPATSPGATVALEGMISNPLADAISAVNLTLELYAFNAYPGNATQPIPAGSAPTFEGPRGPGLLDWFDYPTLSPGSTQTISATIIVPADAATGDYAVRTGLTFTENNSTYLLESRGHFSYAAWTNATSAGGGNSTLNLSRLGVSGILPETAVFVQSNPFPWVLAALLGGALLLGAAGGYYAVSRGRGSTSGARGPPPPASAPRAFGTRRRSDGD